VVAIAGVGHHDIEGLFGLALLAKVPHLAGSDQGGVFLAFDALDRAGQHPTRLGLGTPGEDRVAVADDDASAMDISRGAVDIAAIFDRGRIGSRPGGLIQGEDFHAAQPEVGRDQAGQVHSEPVCILLSLVECGVGAMPLASKDGAEGQLWERTHRRAKQEAIEEFLLGIAAFGEAVVVDGLTKLP
jgi:hypothetical protein